MLTGTRVSQACGYFLKSPSNTPGETEPFPSSFTMLVNMLVSAMFQSAAQLKSASSAFGVESFVTIEFMVSMQTLELFQFGR